MSERAFTVTEEIHIPLQDGTRLASRIWMPEGSDGTPAPSVLEFLPYRKRGGTDARDECTHSALAAAGIVGIRVDIRGTGESDGVIDGEYTPRELADAVEIIHWIAAQPWSNGKVGMMGISWGGFNCLQVAALKPEPLKAVISIASTVDRYNDDIHYKNGCHLSAQFSWATTMLAYCSCAPDQALVGSQWKDMWLERLEDEPFFMEEWIEHQTRDAFWEHGSICESFDAFPVPALVIAGWADGYRNTPLKALEGVPEKTWALVGPWVHKYPHIAYPGPRADFLGEAITWWKRWLQDDENGAKETPRLRAFILDGPRPSGWRDRDPGYWVSIQTWRQPEWKGFGIDQTGRLSADEDVPGRGSVFVRTPLDSGTASGEWFSTKPDAEIAGDQRRDDADAVAFETAPLADELVILGMPELGFDVSCDSDWENVIVRIADVHPDGASTRVSYGVLNLAHRHGNASPSIMPKGEPVSVRIKLDACGYRFKPGHRIRLSLATASFPLILPSPDAPGITVETGSLCLSLPLIGEHNRIDVPEPQKQNPLPQYGMREPGRTRRWVERDLTSGLTHFRIFEDSGLEEHPDNGLRFGERREEIWSIHPADPLSLHGVCKWVMRHQRDSWEACTQIESELTCTKTHWIFSAKVTAFENGREMFQKTFARQERRNFM